jgi:hypothetical protein
LGFGELAKELRKKTPQKEDLPCKADLFSLLSNDLTH